MFDTFQQRYVTVDGVSIFVRVAGVGLPLLLLHGWPQSGLMWRKIATELSQQFTVIIPDLKGYGCSAKPPDEGGHITYSKRVMASEMVNLMQQLGHQRFAVCGHDRGARVAYRMALDHDCVSHLAVLDILPIIDHLPRIGWHGAFAAHHWFFMAQEPPVPERMIQACAVDYATRPLISGCKTAGAIEPEVLQDYQRSFADPAWIHASCEDYRAAVAADLDADRDDRESGKKIECPVKVLWAQQGGLKDHDVLAIWRDWASICSGRPLACGHYLPEELPSAVISELGVFLS
ncbi:MAG: alpha/beta hydrolase [Pseudomonadota bacterium]